VFARNVLYTFSTEVFAVAGNFLIGVILARVLTPSERGILVLVMTLPWIVNSFASLGLPQANIYLLGRKRRDAKTVLGNSLLVSAGASLVLVAALQVMKELVLRTVLKGLPSEYWWQLMLLIPASLVDTMVLSVLRARQRFDLFNLRRLVMPILLLGGLGIGFVTGGRLGTAVAVYTATTALMAVLSLALAGREVPLTLAFDRRLTSESLRFGLKSYMQNLVGRLNYRLDVYVLAFFLSPEQVAFYGVATSVVEVAFYLPNSVGMVLFPRLSSAPTDEAHQITARVCRNTLALTGIIIVGLLVGSGFLVPLLYGAAYKAAIPPLLVLLPGVLSMAIYKVLTRNFTSRDRQQVSIVASVLALVFNVGLDWILIPQWGIVGAATASTMGYTAAGLTLLILFFRESGIPWREVLLPDLNELAEHWRWGKKQLREWIGRRAANGAV
jgi:O-antigen/teichoic acid export membrane protein